MPEEREVCGGITDSGRRAEWIAGRTVVKEWLCEKLGSGARTAEIAIISRDGFGRAVAPRAFWKGSLLPWSISITHAANTVLVALAPGAEERIGADLVPLEGVMPRRLEVWMTPREARWVNLATAGQRRWRTAALWAAKEAAYKALNEGEVFAPEEISVACSDGDDWTAESRGRSCRLHRLDLDALVGVIAVAKSNRGAE